MAAESVAVESPPLAGAMLLGVKLGMTRVFGDDGDSRTVTIIDVGGNRIAQIKTSPVDGYAAAQIAFGARKNKRLPRPLAGHLAKHKAGAARVLREFRVGAGDEAALADLQPGAALPADIFAPGQMVDVQGSTKGKGFAGVIKRHHFRSNRASHGNSRAHRKPGATGQCQDPGRVWPGKKMPGRLGGKMRTTQNLQVVRVDSERNLLVISGAVPGCNGGLVRVRPAVKKPIAVAAAAAVAVAGAEKR